MAGSAGKGLKMGLITENVLHQVAGGPLKYKVCWGGGGALEIKFT